MIEIPEDLIVVWSCQKLYQRCRWHEIAPGIERGMVELPFPRAWILCSAYDLDRREHVSNVTMYDAGEQLVERAISCNGSPDVYVDPATGEVVTIFERRRIALIPEPTASENTFRGKKGGQF